MSGSEHTTIIYVVTFLMFFILVIEGLGSSKLLDNQTYIEQVYQKTVIPEYWQTGYLENGTVYSKSRIGNITLDNPNFWGRTEWNFNTTEPINVHNDTVVWFETDLDVRAFHVHKNVIIPGIWEWETIAYCNPSPITYALAENYLENNVSSIALRCQMGDFRPVIQISFNTSKYADLEDAWNNGELTVLFAVTGETTSQYVNYNVWTLFSQLMLFQMPNVNIYLNAFIAIPIWVCIIIGLIYFLDKILPF